MHRSMIFCACLCSGVPHASAQTFPLVPLTDAIYPADHPELASFTWTNGQGTVSRMGDLDQDGRPDLLVYFPGSAYEQLSSNGALWLFPALAEGGFGQPRFLSVTTTTRAGRVEDMAIHDYDRDGDNDIVFLLDTGPTLVPWLSTPAGFIEGESLSAAGQGFESDASRLILRDLDQDGLEDYLLWNTALKVGAWFTDGGHGHSFVLISDTNPDYTPPIGETNFDVAPSDFEGDGDTDILIRLGIDLYFVEQLAPRSYAPSVPWGVRAAGFSADFDDLGVFADINGDGLVDLVQYGYEQDLYGTDGYAAFIAPFSVGETREVPFFPVPEADRSSYLLDLFHPEPWSGAITSPGDLDGDGSDEVVLTPEETGGTGLCIFDLAGLNGRSGAAMHYSVHGDGWFAVGPNGQMTRDRIGDSDCYSDINGDGVRDRLTVTAVRREHDPQEPETLHSGIMLWGLVSNPYAPDQTLQERDTITTTMSDMTHLTHLDADGDGQAEIILTGQQIVRVIDQDEAGVYRYNRDTRFNDVGGFRSLVARLDDDPTPELISMRLNAGTDRPAPSVYMNIDPGEAGQVVVNEAIDPDDFRSVLDARNISVVMSGGDSSFTAGDVDGDGLDELIIRARYAEGDTGVEHENAAVVWDWDAQGGLTLGAVSALTPVEGPNTELLEAIDLNHDASIDIVSIAGVDGGYALEGYANTGAGRFELVAQVPLETRDEDETPYCLAIEDIDGDGYQDALILCSDRYSVSSVRIVYGGAEGLSADAQAVTGRGAGEVISVDIDGNGLADIVTCSYFRNFKRPNSVTINLQVSARRFMPQISINDLNTAGIDALDLNSDGLDDIIVCEGGIIGSGNTVRVFHSVPEACAADLNLDGTLNFFDIALFVRFYGERRAIADLNRDGVLNFFDVSAMLTGLSDGCP